MPKLRRLTIVTLDPERLAGFYEQVFEMRRAPNPKGEAIYLSDGYFNLTLIPNRAEGKPSGLNHIGFDVDPNETESLLGRFQNWGLPKPGSRAGGGPADLRGTILTAATWTYRRMDFRPGNPLPVSLVTGHDRLDDCRGAISIWRRCASRCRSPSWPRPQRVRGRLQALAGRKENIVEEFEAVRWLTLANIRTWQLSKVESRAGRTLNLIR
jgi:hypothetical protein